MNQNFIHLLQGEKFMYKCQAESEKFNRRDRQGGTKVAKSWHIVVYDQ